MGELEKSYEKNDIFAIFTSVYQPNLSLCLIKCVLMAFGDKRTIEFSFHRKKESEFRKCIIFFVYLLPYIF